MKNTFEPCRLDCDRTMGAGLWYHGQHFTIDINDSFVKKHNLPRIASVISPNGSTFDIFKGIGKSTLGTMMEFQCAVRTGKIA